MKGEKKKKRNSPQHFLTCASHLLGKKARLIGFPDRPGKD